MTKRHLHCILLALLGTACAAVAGADAQERQKPAGQLLVYVGTYTAGSAEAARASRGIYVSRLDLTAGTLARPRLAAATANPSFLAVHPSGPLLYAIGESEQFAGQPAGAVSAFALEPKTGQLTLLNQQSSGGRGPCHVAIDPSGRCALVANYGDGSVACLPIRPDGRLGPATAVVQHHGASVDPKRQEGPHAHGLFVDPGNRFVLAADLGLDKIFVYRFDPAAGKLTPSEPAWCATARGAGPRHLAFHPNGRYVYVINELNSTVTACAYDATHGTLTPRQTISTLPPGFHGRNTAAEIQVHPSGKFLYASNRGDNSLAIFAIDAETGGLRAIGHAATRGRTPRHFAIEPSGRYLVVANQDSANVVVFRIDENGALRPAGELAVPSPVCVTFAAG